MSSGRGLHLQKYPLVQPRPHPHPSHAPHLDLPRLRRVLDHHRRKCHLLDPRLLAPRPRPQHLTSYGRHRWCFSPRRPPRRRRRLARIPPLCWLHDPLQRCMGYAWRILAPVEQDYDGMYLDGDPGVLGWASGEDYPRGSDRTEVCTLEKHPAGKCPCG